MSPASAPGEPGNGASGLWLPVRRSHSHKGGHEIHATGVGNAARIILALCRVAEKIQAIPKPLNGGAGNEHAPLQGIPRLSPGSASYGSEKTARRDRWARSGKHQQKGSGPIGILRQPRFYASLPEQCGLLVTRQTSNGQREAQVSRVRFAYNLG